MTKFEVLWRTSAYDAISVECLKSSFSFYIRNALKQFLCVTNNVNLCFGVTSSLPSPSSLRKVPIFSFRRRVVSQTGSSLKSWNFANDDVRLPPNIDFIDKVKEFIF